MGFLRRHISELTAVDIVFGLFEAASILALLAALFAGQPWLGVAGLALGALGEALRPSVSAYLVRLDAELGATARIRLGVRSGLMVGVLAVDGQGTTATLAAAALLLVAVQVGAGVSRFAARRVRRERLINPLYNMDLDLPLLDTRNRWRDFERYEGSVVEGVELLGYTVAVAALTGSSGVAVTALLVAGAVEIGIAIAALLLSSGKNSEAARDEHHRLARDGIAAYDPEVILYVTMGEQAPYIVGQWLSVLNQIPRRCIFVVREFYNAVWLTDTEWPVIYAPTTRGVEDCVSRSTKVALYFANAGRNVHLVRDARIRHAFLNHGDSDKATSANPVSRMYDEVWVAGEAAADRYAAAGVDLLPGAVRLIGRPQIEELDVGPRASESPTTVLYAPTFEGYFEEINYSSLHGLGPALVKAIIEQRPDIGIIFRPHPNSGIQRKDIRNDREAIARLLRNAPNSHLHRYVPKGSGESLYDNMNSSDALISDVSSVVTDYLATKRPVMVSNPKELDPDAYLEMFPNQAGCYVFDSDIDGFLRLLDEALANDPQMEARAKQGTYLLGRNPEGPVQAFLDAVDDAYEEAAALTVDNTFTFSQLDSAYESGVGTADGEFE